MGLLIYVTPEMGFGDMLLTVLMTASMGAGIFYYTGYSLLREFGLPSDTTMIEFYNFSRGDSQ